MSGGHAARPAARSRCPRPPIGALVGLLVGVLVELTMVAAPVAAQGPAQRPARNSARGSAPGSGGACWRDVGRHVTFGSLEQGQALKRLAPRTPCRALAITWRTRVFPDEASVLAWDVDRQTLTRVHVDPGPGVMSGTRWEQWTGVTTATIAALDPANGFDFASYTQGHDHVVLSPAAVNLLRRRGGTTFRAAW